MLCGASTSRATFEGVEPALRTLFQTFGLPDAIRSDNGSPFASKAPAGLSELSAWWLKLGIRHERIEPGKPQQNGRHERMHLTLKLATASPPASSRKAQQRAFDRFRLEYCALTKRSTNASLPTSTAARSDFDYPEDYERSRVRNSGHLAWTDRSVFVSAALKRQWLGLQWQTNGAGESFSASCLSERSPETASRLSKVVTHVSASLVGPDYRHG